MSKRSAEAEAFMQEWSKRKNPPCPYCAFAGPPYRLELHIREKHTKEKPFRCQICDKSFPRPHNRDRHEVEVHGVEQDKDKPLQPRRPAEQRDMHLAQAEVSRHADRGKKQKPSKSPTLAQLVARADKVDFEALLRRG